MFSYENLEVYKKAFAANQRVYQLLTQRKTLTAYIKNQLGRASLSVVLNIAEGSGKFSAKDRKNFYITARGSVFECASIIAFLWCEGEIATELKNDLTSSFDEISRMLYSMIKNLHD